MAKTKLKIGMRVKVTAQLPKGMSGTGTVIHVGPTGLLVKVQFDGEKYPYACFAADCQEIK